MKKVFLGILMSMAITSSAFAEHYGQEPYVKGVTSEGKPISTSKSQYYVVHGGCRENSQNRELTEVWLFLSSKPYTRYLDSNIRATLYINSPFESLTSLMVCNFLRASYGNQNPVEMTLQPDADHSGGGSLVTSIEKTQIINSAACKSPTLDRDSLENFQANQSRWEPRR